MTLFIMHHHLLGLHGIFHLLGNIHYPSYHFLIILAVLYHHIFSFLVMYSIPLCFIMILFTITLCLVMYFPNSYHSFLIL